MSEQKVTMDAGIKLEKPAAEYSPQELAEIFRKAYGDKRPFVLHAFAWMTDMIMSSIFAAKQPGSEEMVAQMAKTAERHIETIGVALGVNPDDIIIIIQNVEQLAKDIALRRALSGATH